MKRRIYDMVKSVLVNYPESRESDKLLMWMIWSWTLYGNPTGYESIKLDYKLYCDLPNTETVRRSRQHVQERHSELRGSTYIQRTRIKRSLEKGTHVFREETPVRMFDEIKPKNTIVWGT